MLDISAIDVRSGANEGAWLHISHPKTSKLLYADDDCTVPIRVKVRGLESDAVREVRESARRANLAAKQGEVAVSLEELDKLIRLALIVDIEGLGDNGRPFGSTNADKERFLKLSDNINAQVLKFAEDSKNFLE